MSFSFAFSGDDIEDGASNNNNNNNPSSPTQNAPPPPSDAGAPNSASASASAFPVRGKPQLPPQRHDLAVMLSKLPSKIAFSTLDVVLEGGATVQLPRRELWDVRVQLMAEEGHGEDGREGDGVEPGLGRHDVKTGIYEGGFKSWESSIDLVKVLAAEDVAQAMGQGPCRIIELGCGTALPTLALFRWAAAGTSGAAQPRFPLSLTLADYNPSVLYLVTLPNLILAWALQQQHEDQNPALKEAFAEEGELELLPEVIQGFQDFLHTAAISLSFLSGGWSPAFVDLLYHHPAVSGQRDGGAASSKTLVVGAETIYSPFALESFAETVLAILSRERAQRPGGQAAAIVAAKRLYFGVGGSLDDFVDKIRSQGATVNTMREENEGVRRGVVQLFLP